VRVKEVTISGVPMNTHARNDRNERAAIRRYLEPNQKGWFDESMEEIASDRRYLDADAPSARTRRLLPRPCC
jgi:hypothetical protein